MMSEIFLIFFHYQRLTTSTASPRILLFVCVRARSSQCAAGVKLQAVVQGLGKTEAVSGVAAVSRWLRALSLAVVLNQTSSACEDIGHGHGYRVGFRGNVHHDECKSRSNATKKFVRVYRLTIACPCDGEIY